MRLDHGKMYRFKGRAVTLRETADFCRKAKIRFGSGKEIWIASGSLSDY